MLITSLIIFFFNPSGLAGQSPRESPPSAPIPHNTPKCSTVATALHTLPTGNISSHFALGLHSAELKLRKGQLEDRLGVAHYEWAESAISSPKPAVTWPVVIT